MHGSLLLAVGLLMAASAHADAQIRDETADDTPRVHWAEASIKTLVGLGAMPFADFRGHLDYDRPVSRVELARAMVRLAVRFPSLRSLIALPDDPPPREWPPSDLPQRASDSRFLEIAVRTGTISLLIPAYVALPPC